MAHSLTRRTGITLPKSSHVSIWQRIKMMVALRRQRQHLGALDDHMLNDIGISREAAKVEAARAPWDAPSNWLS